MYYVGCGSERQGVIAMQVIIKHFTHYKYAAFMGERGKSTQEENQIGAFAHTC